MWFWGAILSGVILIGGMVYLVARGPLRRFLRQREVDRARRDFKLQREQLEARFFDLAGSRGKPRGLRWVECDWQNDVALARDRESGLLAAFVGVNVRFEAVAGGDMEDVEAVGTVRDAAAVFHYRKGVWGTGGRALFNMNPQEAVSRLEGQFDPVREASTMPIHSSPGSRS